VLARCDPLTGVQNRRYFLEHFETIFEAARAEGRSLCCIMVDIDLFKRINDEHGHVAGDEVIRRVAEVLQTELRATDAICRYGGEEFLLLLRDAGVERGLVVAERLRRRVAAPAFARVPVTASFGVSSSEFGATSSEELITQADDALYASKGAGRDRVTRWDGIGQ
jgi:diguanylate cyclase (GGDEF)-like protein